MKTIDIFYVVLSIVSVVITGIVIPLLKSKISKNNIDKTLELVKIAVNAAEQIYKTAGQGDLKKKYVLQYLKDRNIKVSEEDLNNMIEASVLEINKWKKEIEAQPVVNVINTEEVVKA